MDLVVIVMKKTKLLNGMCLISVVVIAVILLIVISRWAIVQVFWANPAISQTVNSPDGKYTAYVFESNSGATSGWVYHISILPSGKTLYKGNGNVYINSSTPPNNVEWLSNNELYVDDYRSINTTKQKQSIYGITVKYRSLE